MKPKPRVLVTGAPGWLGSSLVLSLVNGFRQGPVDHKPEPVRIVALPGSDSRQLTDTGKVEVATADLRDRRLPDGLFDGIDTVFHCAGIIHAKRIKDLYEVNVDATRNLLEGAIQAGVKRFVFVSSNSPAGLNESPTRLMVEDDPPRPYLGYGLSKLQSEWLVNGAHRAGKIESVIVRPCWFYGPTQPLRQTTFFTRIKGVHPPSWGGATTSAA
jgi:nucleoside-diphosphate-sugar epimerase